MARHAEATPCRICGHHTREALYRGPYRALVDGTDSPADFHRTHDPEQVERVRMLGTAGLLGSVLMDIGCGGGSFLDVVGDSRRDLAAARQCGCRSVGIRSADNDFDEPLPLLDDISQLDSVIEAVASARAGRC